MNLMSERSFANMVCLLFPAQIRLDDSSARRHRPPHRCVFDVQDQNVPRSAEIFVVRHARIDRNNVSCRTEKLSGNLAASRVTARRAAGTELRMISVVGFEYAEPSTCHQRKSNSYGPQWLCDG